MFDFIKYTKIWLSISGILMAASAIVLVLFGLKLGIDFTGGSMIRLEFTNKIPSQEEILKAVNNDFGNIIFQSAENSAVYLKLRYLDNNEYSSFIEKIKSKFDNDSQYDFSNSYIESIGPSIGKELSSKSKQAIVITIIAIVLFIAWAFRRVSHPVKSWKYGIIAIIALIHDIMLPVGIFALLGKLFGIEVDILFITALLVILGYSVNDTIIIFDRIRENLIKNKQKPFSEVVNLSLNETLIRSFNTSFTVVLVLAAILILGGESIRYFTFALMLGVIAGTYSSIFIASPLLVLWQKDSVQKN